ncbi:MAG: DUF4339 domain-containing protein, partial [Planctomycetaceae bacterium]|nr:DUF4339 domain-containing protein [Planctomycetaceae bacterium]
MSSKTQRPSTSHTSSTDEWYVRRETEVLGPYSLAQLAEQFQSGRLTDFDIARQGRHGAWQRIGELPLTKMAAALDATIPDVSLISPRTAPLVTPPVETFGTSAKPTESKPPPSRPAPSQTLHRPDKTPSAPSRPSASPADYVVWSASMQWEPPREAEAPLAEMHDASLWLKGPVEPTTPAAPNEVFAQELPAQVASDSEKSVPSEIRADLTDREEVASPHVPLPAAEALPSPTAEAASVEPSPGEEIPQAGRVDASLWLRGPVSAPPPEMAPHAPDGPQASDVPPTELPEAERQDASLWLR